MESGATFSKCKKYRYDLWRIWDKKLPTVFWVMLNPSTADGNKDDPTIRRCIAYAKYWGYGGIHVGNLFTYITTDPEILKTLRKPFINEFYISLLNSANNQKLVLCGWGNKGNYLNMSNHFCKYMSIKNIPLYCLGLTNSGEPKHPLYLRKDLIPVEFVNNKLFYRGD